MISESVNKLGESQSPMQPGLSADDVDWMVTEVDLLRRSMK